MREDVVLTRRLLQLLFRPELDLFVEQGGGTPLGFVGAMAVVDHGGGCVWHGKRGCIDWNNKNNMLLKDRW